ncbi:MAG: UDP-N-acetylglucosamine 2-epimerase (non-hydrolyzing) [bacterium]|nr:UDP-N-acetylglucosamine 2-epimerase (non-hydrolyzing) [bacterium]
MGGVTKGLYGIHIGSSKYKRKNYTGGNVSVNNYSRNKIVDLVAGARPNFIKLAPIVRAIDERHLFEYRIVHTGQHYDENMNDIFFTQLGIPKPDVHLEVGSGTHGLQTARILERYERHLIKNRTSVTVVFGDVNSTIACAMAAVKLRVPVVHVEAGLRSLDRTMPEEINRILTDAIADLLLVNEQSGLEFLAKEGIPQEKVKLVGNVMIDTLVAELPIFQQLKMYTKYGLKKKEYALLTLHRPSNVDDPKILRSLMELFVEISREIDIVFPMHPRTCQMIETNGLRQIFKGTRKIHVCEPLSYRENLSLMAGARAVFTDSGGMQEETAILRVPCITLRFNTERPVTCKLGTSRLVGNDIEQIRRAFDDLMADDWPKGQDIPFWDGHAAQRIVHHITELLGSSIP